MRAGCKKNQVQTNQSSLKNSVNSAVCASNTTEDKDYSAYCFIALNGSMTGWLLDSRATEYLVGGNGYLENVRRPTIPIKIRAVKSDVILLAKEIGELNI